MNKNTVYIIIIVILIALGGYMLFKPASPTQGFNSTALPSNGLIGDTTAERAAHPDNPNAQPVPSISEQVAPPAPAGAPAVPPVAASAAIPPLPAGSAPTPAAPYNPANDPLASMGASSNAPITAGNLPGQDAAPPAPGTISAGIPPSNAPIVPPTAQVPNNVLIDDVPSGAEVAPAPASNTLPPANALHVTPGEGQ